MRVEIRTRAERPVPWPESEPPPAVHDQVFWDGELWSVGPVRWDIDAGVCRVTIAPFAAMYDAASRAK